MQKPQNQVKKTLRYITLLLAFWTIFSSGMAQSLWPISNSENDFLFVNYNIYNGLSNNNVLDIFQDQKGFIWIATEDGLNRFDGYSFLVFKNNSGDFTSISADIITDIDEDSDGNLWISTVNGLNRYDAEKNMFIKYFHNSEDNSSLSNNYVRAILCEGDSIVWAETVDGILNKLNTISGECRHYQHRALHQSYYHYHAIYKTDSHNIWIGSRNINPYHFNTQAEKFTFYTSSFTDSLKKRESDVAFFFKDSQSRFWVGGLDGLYYLDSDGNFHRKIATSSFDAVEDQQGRLWVATGDGLRLKAKNQKSMFALRHNNYNKQSVIGNHVNCLLVDRDNNLWVGTTNGLSFHRISGENIAHYSYQIDDVNSISANEISAVAEDTLTGKLWIATEKDGLNVLDMESMQINRFHMDIPSAHAARRIKSLTFGRDNTLWIGLWSGQGFNKLDTKTKNIQTYRFDSHNTYSDWYSGFVDLNDDSLLIALWGDDGLLLFDKKKGQFAQSALQTEIVLNDNGAHQIVKLDEDIYWFLNAENKLMQFNYTDWELTKIIDIQNINKDYKRSVALRNNNYRLKKLPDFGEIYQLVQGFDSRIIILSQHGVYYYSLADKHFGKLSDVGYSKIAVDSIAKRIWCYGKKGLQAFDFSSKEPISLDVDLFSKFENLETKHIACENNMLYIADGLILSKMQLQDAKIILESNYKLPQAVNQIVLKNKKLFVVSNRAVYKFEKQGFVPIFESDKYSPVVSQINDGKIYIAVHKHLFSYHIISDSLSSYDFLNFDYNFSLDNLQILDIKNVDSRQIMLGTSKGIMIYVKANNKLKPVRYNEASYCARSMHLATAIVQTNDSTIWIGTTNEGLKRYNLKTHKLYSYDSDIQNKNAFWGSTVSTLFVDKDHHLWVGGRGLNKYIAAIDGFQHFTKEEGLRGNNIRGIAQDKSGNLWIASEVGLEVMNQKFQSFKTFNLNTDDTPIDLTSALCYLSDHRLFVGSKNGFYIFNPDSLKAFDEKSNLQITALYVNDAVYQYGISSHIPSTFGYNQNTISFEFASLQFYNSRNINYLYRLRGFDDKWVEAGAQQRKVRYANLDAGTYIFELKIKNTEEKSGVGQMLKYEFRIEAPYWQKWWFISLAILFFVAPVFIFAWLRLQKIRQERRSLLLEQQLLRSQMNPHFIFNSLNSIQSYIFENNPMQAATYLSKFAHLIRMILVNSRSAFISLKEEIDTLENYLELQKIRFEDKFDYTINTDSNLDVNTVSIPPMLAQPFIENAIEHGFKDVDYKGNIEVLFEKQENKLIVIIQDNGRGIEASLREKMGGKTYKSLSTIIMKNRIAILRKRHKLKFSVMIDDLSKTNGQGTRVKIVLPIIRSEHS